MPGHVRENLKARVSAGETPGIIAGITTAAGPEFIAEGKTGLGGNSRVISESTMFEIGSISKTFTALLFQIALDGGKLKENDAISEHLPADLKLDAATAAITLEQLATHRSGLARMPDNFKPADATNPYADYSVQQLYAWLQGTKPRKPGTVEYSNAGMGLLGHIIARTAGAEYEDVMRSWIATPLSMPDTCITLSAEQRGRSAAPHLDGKAIPMWDIPTLAGAGAIRSTPRDLLRWVALNAGIEKCPLTAAMERTHKPRGKRGPRGSQVALGWMITPSKNGPLLWHNGGTGGTRSWAGFNLKTRTAAIVLANSRTEIDDIGMHLLSPDFPLRSPQAVARLSADDLKSCEGFYVFSPFSIITIKATDTHLTAQLTGQSALAAYPSARNEFFLRVVDARLTFEPGPDGKAAAVILHQNGRDQRAPRAIEKK